MKLAVFGDVHANLEALAAVMSDAATYGVTDYACIGDVVGYGANPSECLAIVRELNCPVVKGNHDADVSDGEELLNMNPVARAALEWTRGQLTADELQWLGALPLVELGGDKRLTFVHATLNKPDSWLYIFDRFDAGASMVHQTKELCFYGHTHKPMAFVSNGHTFPLQQEAGEIQIAPDEKYLINVGSVGQPRDGDSRACYAVYDSDSKTVKHRRVTYDIETAQEKIKDAQLPEMLSRRLALGK